METWVLPMKFTVGQELTNPVETNGNTNSADVLG